MTPSSRAISASALVICSSTETVPSFELASGWSSSLGGLGTRTIQSWRLGGSGRRETFVASSDDFWAVAAILGATDAEGDASGVTAGCASSRFSKPGGGFICFVDDPSTPSEPRISAIRGGVATGKRLGLEHLRVGCAHADLGGGWLTDSGSRTFRDVDARFGAVAGIGTVVGLASHAHGG